MLTDNTGFTVRHLHKKVQAAAGIVMLCCMMTACGGVFADKADTNGIEAEENVSEGAETEGKSDEAVLSSEGMTAEEGVINDESTYAEAPDYEESIAAEKAELAEGESPYFGIMHASIIDINGSVGESSTVYSFKDKIDPENIWSVTGLEIGDIETDMAVGNDVVVLFNGDIVKDAENLQFLVLLPEGQYELKKAEGVTTSSTMSVFSIRTSDGATVDLLKDNCRMDEDTLKADSGDKVRVYYADGGELGNYPLRVFAAD